MKESAPKFCAVCESALKPGAEYCHKCGGGPRTMRVPTFVLPKADKPFVSDFPTDEGEPEVAPPPPAKGKAVSWQRNAKSGLRPAGEPPPARSAGAAAGFPAAAAAGSGPAPSAPEKPPELPPAPEPWPFRQSLVELGSKISISLTEAIGQKGKPAAAVVDRLIAGALCHPHIYRFAAQKPDLTQEAAWICVAATVLTTLIYFNALFSAIGFVFVLKTIILRFVFLGAFVFALQLGAKHLHQVDIAFLPWFRAFAYASVAGALGGIPVVGLIFGLWALVCALAAVMDVSGTDVGKSLILLVIAIVASGVAGTLGSSLLL